jgi:hypothetical protein
MRGAAPPLQPQCHAFAAQFLVYPAVVGLHEDSGLASCGYHALSSATKPRVFEHVVDLPRGTGWPRPASGGNVSVFGRRENS